MTTDEAITRIIRIWEDKKSKPLEYYQEETIFENADIYELIPCSERLPKVEKKYLCQLNKDFSVLRFSKDLYEVDENAFSDKKGVSGFYAYDSENEWGFYSVNVINSWRKPIGLPMG